MRVKILSSTSTFNGVSYNTRKTHTSKGELMKIKNFGFLQSSNGVTPDEIKTFLKAYSNRNARVKDKQFHAMISCKGREYSKEELTKIAEDWLQKMGYGDNPFLIVFHSDTKNNHVHLVSTRIGKDGKKIKDNMERIKAQTFLNEIMQLDPKQDCQKSISNLESFYLSTPNQARLYFEAQGYHLKEEQGLIKLFKFGLLQGEIQLKEIERQAKAGTQDQQRIKQLKAIINKYMRIYRSNPDPVYEPVRGNKTGKLKGYRSELSDYLKDKFGIELIFHGKGEKKPYGYTIIDHKGKNIFKGGEIFPLKELIAGKSTSREKEVATPREEEVAVGTVPRQGFKSEFLPNTKEYRLKILSALEEFPTVHEGLLTYNIEIVLFQDRLYLRDTHNRYFESLEGLLTPKEYSKFSSQLKDSAKLFREDLQMENWLLHSNRRDDSAPFKDSSIQAEMGESTYDNRCVQVSLSISEDVDDEGLHGRERKKQRRNARKLK